MPAGVGVFSPEGGTEGIDIAKGQGIYLGLQLAAHGQTGPAPEKLFLGAALACSRMRPCGRHLEHLTGSLAVTGCDDRSMHLHEASLLEKTVYRKGETRADAGDSPQGVGARAEMGYFPEKLKRVPLLLQWIIFRVSPTEHLNPGSQEFDSLTLGRRGLERPLDPDAATGGQTLDILLIIFEPFVGDNLEIRQT